MSNYKECRDCESDSFKIEFLGPHIHIKCAECGKPGGEIGTV